VDTEAVADLEILEQAPLRIEEQRKKAEETRREIEQLKKQLESRRSNASARQQEILLRKAELQKLLDELEKAKQDEPSLPPVQLVDQDQLEKRLRALEEEFNEISRILSERPARQ